MNKSYYRSEIDGLRALAILPVILYHTYSFSFAESGFLGVDIFFVISGFLITNILLNEILVTKKISLINFYNRRIRRIIPALFFVTIVSIYPAYKLLFPFTFKDFGQSLMGVSTLLPNLIFILQGGYFAEANSLKPLLHTWSLGVEEQFYFFFPLFLLIFWKILKRNTIILIIILFLLSFILSNDLSDGVYTQENFLLPITRMWELFAGAIISYYNFFLKKKEFNFFVKNIFSFFGVLLLIYSFFSFSEVTPHPSFFTFIPVLGTCLIILFASKETIIGKILSFRYLVGIGLISYSLYLWHYPFFVFARHYNFLFNSESGSYYTLSNLTYFFLILIVFIISYFSWKYIEQPFRKRKISNKNLIKSVTVCFLIIFVSGFYINKNDGIIERFPNKVVNYLDYNYSYPPNKIIFPCTESLSEKIKRRIQNEKYSQKEIFEECRILGNKQYKPKTVLLGDSFTHSLLLQINDHLLDHNKSIYYHLRACPNLIRFMDHGDCFKALKSISNDPNIENVIFFFRWSDKFKSVNYFDGKYFCGEIRCKDLNEAKLFEQMEKEIQGNFREKINLLLEKNIKVTIIYPLPYIGYDVPKFLASKVLNNKDPVAAIDYKDFTYINSNVIRFFNSLEGNIIRVHPEKIFCNSFVKDKCVANNKEKVFFWNKTHLSLDGGILLANEIIKKVDKF